MELAFCFLRGFVKTFFRRVLTIFVTVFLNG